MCQGCNNINIPKPPEDDSNGESDEDTESSYTESDEESELVEEEVITDNLFLTHIMTLHENMVDRHRY